MPSTAIRRFDYDEQARRLAAVFATISPLSESHDANAPWRW
jgi:hypothetical protein